MKIRLRKNIYTNIILLLTGLLLLLILVFFFNRYLQQQKQNYANLQVLINQNTVLIEKIYVNAFQLRDNNEQFINEIQQDRQIIQKIITVLKEGGIISLLSEQKIKPLQNQNFNIRLNELVKEWKAFEEIIQKTVETPVFLSFAPKESIKETKKVMNPAYENLLAKIGKSKKELLTIHSNLLEINQQKYHKTKKYNGILIIISFIIIFASLFFVLYYLRKALFIPLQTINNDLDKLVNGAEKNRKNIAIGHEIVEIQSSIQELNDKYDRIAYYIKSIGEGNFSADLGNISESDKLASALIVMRDNFKKTEEENKIRKIEEEQRIWQNNGLAKFVELLRESNKGIKDLSNKLLSSLISYLNAAQGAIFMYNDSQHDEEPFLDLIAAYAYDRHKLIDKKIKPGEGLIGACFLESQSIFLTDIPESFFSVSSGMGYSKPKCLFLVPLIHDGKPLGVLELASFDILKKFEMEFIEKLSENIATTLSSTAVNEKTNQLLYKAQEQAEALQAQEEEMRQNLEEMQATQEEAHKRSIELHDVVSAINSTVMTYELSTDGYYLNANNLYLDSLKLSIEELTGSQHYERVKESFTGYSAYETFLARIKRGIQSRKEIRYLENGIRVIHDETYTPIHNANEEVTKIMVLAYKKDEPAIDQQTNLEIEKLKNELENCRQSLILAEEKIREISANESNDDIDINELTWAIANHELELTEIFEASREGIFKLDANGMITAVNTAACIMIGNASENLINRHISSVLNSFTFIHSKADPEEVLNYLKHAETIEFTNNEGKKLLVSVKGITYKIDGKDQYLILINNLSDFKKLTDEMARIKEEWEQKEFELITKIKELSQEKELMKEESPEHLTEDVEKGFIVWYKKYNLDISEMDEQHKRIVKLVNELKEAADHDKPSAELIKIYKNLINYTSYHFHTEENYFTKFGFEETDVHALSHKQLMQILNDIQKSIGNKGRLYDMLDQLKDELLNHFTNVDIQYVSLFHRNLK